MPAVMDTFRVVQAGERLIVRAVSTGYVTIDAPESGLLVYTHDGGDMLPAWLPGSQLRRHSAAILDLLRGDAP